MIITVVFSALWNTEVWTVGVNNGCRARIKYPSFLPGSCWKLLFISSSLVFLLLVPLFSYFVPPSVELFFARHLPALST